MDLNRNYDASFLEAGSSSNECAADYAGKFAFSEPEAYYHKTHLSKLKQIKAYLSYHSFGQKIIYPYSMSFSAEAHNKAELDILAQRMRERIKVFNSTSV